SIKEIRFTATVGEAGIDEFLAGEEPPDEKIRKVRVTFGEGNLVKIAAERETLGVGVPFTATGPLRLVSPTRMELDPTRLVVVGIPLEGVPLRFLKDRFESSIDLASLPVAATLTDVRTIRGKLLLSGSLNPAPFLQHSLDTRQ
ncbi:MAG TPA: LmeA family phospholipid-binding protein, partial [Chthonomonadaceae bacterium]|nr:LmeA family phospholipid-binding protein [Chthonomonadaceae bacterium]